MFILNFFLWLWYGPEQYERIKQDRATVRYKSDANQDLDRIFKNGVDYKSDKQ